MSDTFNSIVAGFGSPEPLPRGERGGEYVKGESEAALDIRRGQRPLSLQVPDARSADLITPAQVTPPHWTVNQREFNSTRSDRQRRTLLDRSKVRSGLYPVNDVYNVARKGLGRGYRQLGATQGEWDISGTCENRRPVTLDGAPARLSGGRYVRANGRPLTVILYTRCRKCPPCLGRRRNLWAARARDEVQLATRTWFATLTLAPAAHWMLECRASARLTEGGVDLRKLPPDEAFAEIVKEYSAELTKFFKRVRKNSGAKLRYLLVAEPHKSGKPHFHALIHEIGSEVPIRHAVLRSAWDLGFTKFKLVERDVKACWYVAKYLAKSVASRVRASLAYGSGGDRKQNATTEEHSERKDEDRTWPPAPSFPTQVGTKPNEETTSQGLVVDNKNQPTKDEDYDDLHHDLQRRSIARDKAAHGAAPWTGSSTGFQPATRQGSGTGPSTPPPHARSLSSAIQSLQTLCATLGAGGFRYTQPPKTPRKGT